MSGNHSTVNVKNYQFLYPSVALWQDFNDLDLLDSKKKKKSGKSKPKGKKSSYFSKGRSEGTERPKNMKRKNPTFGQPFGAFIRPSEFTLEYSVLLPSSRAGIRLKPIDNAPVPKVDKKNKKAGLPNVAPKPKFCVPEMTAEVVQEQNLPMLKPITSWSPPDIRENTELTKEPTLYLDLNYGSDGDVDMVELHDSTHRDTKRRSAENKSNKNEVLNVAFPQISRDMTQSLNVMNDSPDLPKLGVCEIKSVVEKVQEIAMVQHTETLPKLAVDDSETMLTKKSNRLTDSQKTDSKTRTLPYIKASQSRTKPTARYTVKSRYMKASTRSTKLDETEPRMKTNREFLVGGGNALNRKKAMNITRKPKEKVVEKRLPLFEKRKVFETRNNGKDINQEVPPDSLPNICDDMTSLKCDQVSDEISEGTLEACVDCESSQENTISAEVSPRPKSPSVASTRLEEFEIDLDERRTGTPRLLECPFRKMKKNQRELFEQKRATFRKLDADGDGHLSLFELMKSFPEDLTRFQMEYLKMIYQEACSSTFFGLEEFLCVDEMCSTMTSMSEELQAVFSKTHPRDVQAKLGYFLSMFLAAYDSSSEAAVFPGLSEKAQTLSDDASLKKLLDLFKSLSKDIDNGIRKPDFLLMIPFMLERDAVILENLFD